MALRIPCDVPADNAELADLIIQVGQEFQEVMREIGDGNPTADQAEWFAGLSGEHARLTRIWNERVGGAAPHRDTHGRPVY